VMTRRTHAIIRAFKIEKRRRKACTRIGDTKDRGIERRRTVVRRGNAITVNTFDYSCVPSTYETGTLLMLELIFALGFESSTIQAIFKPSLHFTLKSLEDFDLRPEFRKLSRNFCPNTAILTIRAVTERQNAGTHQ